MLKTLAKEQRFILFVLFFINFFNYLDRQVIFPLFHDIKLEFGLTDFQLGLLGTVFMLVHSLASLPLGILADKYSRKLIISISVAFWSIMTFTTGLARSFNQLLGARSLVGLGESGYAPAATAMISDNFPQSVRARAQGFFNIGMFTGGTLGAIIGGIIVYYLSNWRLAFFLVSLPGLLLAIFSLRMKDHRIVHPEEKRPLALLFKNPAYNWIVVNAILSTFAAAAFVAWGIEFVSRYKGYNLRDASLILGSTLMVAGVLGIVLGSHLADYLQQKIAWGRSIVVGLSLMISTPLMLLGFHGNRVSFIIFFFLGTMFLSFYHGPVIAVMHDVVPAHMRATSFSVYTILAHLLGSTFAPAVVGAISDRAGLIRGLEFSALLVFFAGLSFLAVSRLIAKGRVIIHQD